MIPALIVLAYLAVVVYIGVFAFRQARGKEEVEEYFLASRSIGPFVFLMSLFGTNMTAFAILGLLRFLPTMRGPLAVLVGVGVWVALYESGIDPVISGLAIGLVTSAYPPSREELERATDLTREFREQPTAGGAITARRSLAQTISANERIQFALHPWTSYVIVPLFALANAGVHITGGLLSDAVTSPITIGIVAAYVVGKPLGIFLVPWLATRAPVRKVVGGGTKVVGGRLPLL